MAGAHISAKAPLVKKNEFEDPEVKPPDPDQPAKGPQRAIIVDFCQLGARVRRSREIFDLPRWRFGIKGTPTYIYIYIKTYGNHKHTHTHRIVWSGMVRFSPACMQKVLD